jgi:hypothetical protein
VICGNGSLACVTDRPVDVVVLNARNEASTRKKAKTWSPAQCAQRQTMLVQLANRHVRLLVSLARSRVLSDLVARLGHQRFTFDHKLTLDLHQTLVQIGEVYDEPFPCEDRREDLETLTPAQRAFLADVARRRSRPYIAIGRPSNGMTTACLALAAGAREVVLCGIGMRDGGYAYAPDAQPYHNRVAHIAADKLLLGHLVQRYRVSTTSPDLREYHHEGQNRHEGHDLAGRQ